MHILAALEIIATLDPAFSTNINEWADAEFHELAADIAAHTLGNKIPKNSIYYQYFDHAGTSIRPCTSTKQFKAGNKLPTTEQQSILYNISLLDGCNEWEKSEKFEIAQDLATLALGYSVPASDHPNTPRAVWKYFDKSGRPRSDQPEL